MAKTKQATIGELISVGQLMSNILYNLAQKDEFKGHRAIMDSYRKQWDETLHSLPKQTNTFWLARDRDNTSCNYCMSRSRMRFICDQFIPENRSAITCIENDHIKLLGLPTLRKGQ